MKIALGCVAENNPKYLGQALRLIQSIRWFGGTLNQADFYICAVDGMDASYRMEFEHYGAIIKIVPRYSERHPQSNKLRFLQLPELDAYEHVLLLDCDTIVVNDPSTGIFQADFAAKIADVATVPIATFRHLFAAFGLPLPKADRHCTVSGEATIPYFNAGVLAFSHRAMEKLVPQWLDINAQLISQLALLGEHKNFCEQASLSLALVATATPFEALGNQFNFPTHFKKLDAAPCLKDIEPFIIHYHWLTDTSGNILPSAYPTVNRHIDEFNARLLQERKVNIRKTIQNDPLDRKAIIVLGMHRSGTSATAGMLHLLGAEVGSRLLETQEHVNAEGFWENADVVAFHDRLFDQFSSGWWDISPIHTGNWESSIHELTNFLQLEFGQSRLWLVKDPRLCRFIPLWKAALKNMGIAPHFLIVLRHPHEVAESLIKRDGLSYPHALLLWLRHVLDSEKGSRGLARSVITYEDLLADWKSSIGRVATNLKIDLDINEQSITERIDTFIKPQLRHHFSNLPPSVPHLLSLATTTYEALQAGDTSTIDAITAEVEMEIESSTPWVKQMGGLMSKLDDSKFHAVQLVAETASLRAEIARIKGSFSWRITKPLRATGNLIK